MDNLCPVNVVSVQLLLTSRLMFLAGPCPRESRSWIAAISRDNISSDRTEASILNWTRSSRDTSGVAVAPSLPLQLCAICRVREPRRLIAIVQESAEHLEFLAVITVGHDTAAADTAQL